MAEPASGPHKPTSDPKLLREDLGKEYYEVLGVVSSYDGWLLIVKGWSVTLSLAALGLGFQQRHYAFFGIAAVTGAAFWYLDALMKGYQYRYYIRMREIEYTAYLINRVRFDSPEEYRDSEISAPRVDMMWGFRGYLFAKDDKGKDIKDKPLVDKYGAPWPHPLWRRAPRPPKKSESDARESEPGTEETEPNADWRPDVPWRRSPDKIYNDLRRRWRWPNVMLPHVVAVVLGLLLLIIFASLNAAGVGHLGL
jgi:hypothetical protein